MATQRYQALKLNTNNLHQVEDALALEHPLSVSINQESFTLTMQTPGNEKELVRGLLFTEGIIKRKSGELNMFVMETSDTGHISKINVEVPPNELDHSLLNKRNLLSVASCGICGKTELIIPTDDKLNIDGTLKFSEIHTMFTLMASSQNAFQESGGSHASAAFSSGQEMLCIYEDIGRHNAVDKVIGHLLNNGVLKNAKYLLVSGRVSYEIVVKCFVAGIPFLLAVSAPSSLAVDFAKEFGITLIGFCRSDRATVYSNPHRLHQ